jgi:hypothetical protein
MSMDGTSTTAVTPLLALGGADAAVCADGFCAVPPAKTVLTGPEQAGSGE